MPEFIYQAKKSPQEVVNGVVTADTKMVAIQKIAGMGLFLLRIDEGTGPKDLFRGRRKKVPLKDISNFTRQLSDLLGSGLPIVKALRILERQTGNKSLRGIIASAREACIEGHPLSKALGQYPDIFSDLYVNLIRTGEASGALEEVLKRLADYHDKQLEIQTKTRSALAYPALMSIVGLITILVLLTFVIPKITGMFEDLGQELPMPTRILMSVSGAIKDYGWLILLALSGAGIFLKKTFQTVKGREVIERLEFRIPFLGDLILKTETARFAGTLGMLLKNGIPMLESLEIVRETMNHKLMSDAIAKASLKVREGTSLADALHESPLMPPLLVNMIGVGEESGKIDSTLLKLADSYEREADAATKVVMSLLEPVLILALGLVVGFIVISMLLPIFEINFLVR